MWTGNPFSPNQPNQDVDPELTMYTNLPQDQQRAIARHYMSEFQNVGIPESQQEFAHIDPEDITNEQLVTMHRYAQQHHPGILASIHKLFFGK